MREALSWSFVRHAVGDMVNDEEYQAVRVRLPDGSMIEVVGLEKDGQGQWVLVARDVVKKEMT